jgi:hypothetical protein
MPEFGAMRMIDILPEHIRDWIAGQKAIGVSASTIAGNKNILSAIFTTAFNDQVVFLHPCAGVKPPTVARKPRVIVTPEQYDAIHRALPGTTTRLMVETAIESGLRWGELTELRPAAVCDALRDHIANHKLDRADLLFSFALVDAATGRTSADTTPRAKQRRGPSRLGVLNRTTEAGLTRTAPSPPTPSAGVAAPTARPPSRPTEPTDARPAKTTPEAPGS